MRAAVETGKREYRHETKGIEFNADDLVGSVEAFSHRLTGTGALPPTSGFGLRPAGCWPAAMENEFDSIPEP